MSLIMGSFSATVLVVKKLNYCTLYLLLTKGIADVIFSICYITRKKAETLHSQVKFVGNKAKGWISKRVFQENKARQFFRKTNISYPLICTRTCGTGGKKCSFFGKFGVLCYLETPVLRFAFLPYYRQIIILFQCLNIFMGKTNSAVSLALRQ